MTETSLKQVPVKIEYGGKWISTKIGVNEEKILFPEPISAEIKIKTIDDLEEKKNIITISTKKGESYKIASIPKVLQNITKDNNHGMFGIQAHGIFYVSCDKRRCHGKQCLLGEMCNCGFKNRDLVCEQEQADLHTS
ncbi:hypothetical protein [Methanolacinia petrolearia]|uniref:hypothetical protein n=1 Tax=Methanolacinia petrolearia TaxID=54120 RepID=UPI003BAB2910